MIAIPTGFRAASASGLIVPEPLSRGRQVFTKDETRLIARATKLLQHRGVAVFFGCAERACQQQPLERVQRTDGFVLQCPHLDRVFTQAF